jgi:hypothetical protein
VKSERKVSIKTPITTLHLAANETGAPGIDAVIPDLRHTVAAANVVVYEGGFIPGDPVETDDGGYRLVVDLAPAA